jgi:hypothetical protein
MRKPYLVFTGEQDKVDEFDSQHVTYDDAIGAAEKAENRGEFAMIVDLRSTVTYGQGVVYSTT